MHMPSRLMSMVCFHTVTSHSLVAFHSHHHVRSSDLIKYWYLNFVLYGLSNVNVLLSIPFYEGNGGQERESMEKGKKSHILEFFLGRKDKTGKKKENSVNFSPKIFFS